MTEPAAKPPRTWLPMTLWSAGIALLVGLLWLGTEAYARHRFLQRVEKVLQDRILLASGFGGHSPDLAGAAQALGGPEQALALLRRYLAMKRPYRSEAIWLLGACGRPAVPDLIRHLGSGEIVERHNAMRALSGMKAEAIDALPAIIEVTRRGEQPLERRMAIMALRQVGGDSPEVVSALTAALADPDEGTVAWAIPELMMIGPAAAPAAPELARVLTRGDAGVRTYAALALERIGPRAASAVPALEAALADDNAMVRTAAARALKQVRGEEPTK